MMARLWAIIATGALTAALIMLSAAPAGADDAIPVRHESAGVECGITYSAWWEDGALVSVGVQAEPDFDGHVILNGFIYGPPDYQRTDGATWMITHSLPDAPTIILEVGDCRAYIDGPLLSPPTVDVPFEDADNLTTRYSDERRVLPTR